MHGHVIAEFLTSFAAFSTLAALERQLPSVGHHVDFEGVRPGEGSPAVCAQVVSGQGLFLMLVKLMGLELAVGGKAVTALGTAVWFFSSVYSLMNFQRWLSFETFLAKGTLEWPVIVMDQHVSSQPPRVTVGVEAFVTRKAFLV